MDKAGEIWLIRHGETEWSLSGAHTGLTDLPLTERGKERAAQLGAYLRGKAFGLVLTSPLARAKDTCRLAGYGDVAQTDNNLVEWNYGDYEGKSTPEIRQKRAGWNLWRDGVPNGETADQVAVRAREVLARVDHVSGDVALFAHGHVLRILTACWLQLPPACGKLFALSTATVSILAHERDQHVIERWNQPVTEESDGQ